MKTKLLTDITEQKAVAARYPKCEHGKPSCRAVDPSYGFFCVRPPDHTCPHVAHGVNGEIAHAMWDDMPETPRPVISATDAELQSYLDELRRDIETIEAETIAAKSRALHLSDLAEQAIEELNARAAKSFGMEGAL